ncbi:uridylate kinase [Methylomonas sp. AM2-LC]|uniref:amino acid kinase family protein n=1 Tax=Methylomonas sp. AM2-LC TaxID=3153301 RepID=UPI003264B273
MRIIKLGGSLLSSQVLPACLDYVAELPGQTLLVPGGGIFADQVRSLQSVYQFNDISAHRMAVLAMQQMALLFNGLKPNFSIYNSIYAPCNWQGVAVWSANIKELDTEGITNSWDITSDSLAAWLAYYLHASALIVVKAASIDPTASTLQLQQQGIVDAGFNQFAKQLCCPVHIINKDRFLTTSCLI